MSASSKSTTGASASASSFLEEILAPGSSLHPKFLFALDVAFSALFVVLLTLVYLTRNWHVMALLGIEVGLWATVKWSVHFTLFIPIYQFLSYIMAGSCTK